MTIPTEPIGSVPRPSDLYPQEGIAGYSQEAFLADLVSEAESETSGAASRKAPAAFRSTSPRAGCRSN